MIRPVTANEPLDFHAIFEAAPSPNLVVRADPQFTIVAANDAYLRATMTTRDRIVGRPIFEAFPDNPNDPEATGVRRVRESIEFVIAQRQPHTMAVQKYDIPRPGGGFEERYWSPIHTPVFGPDGDVTYVIQRPEDVTEFVRLKAREGEQDRRAAELRGRAERVEAEVFLRAQELARANADLRRQVAEREWAEAALAREQDFLRAVLDHAADGIVACDGDGVLRFFNRAAREFHGVAEQPLPPERWAEHYDLYLPDGKTPMTTEQVPLFRALSEGSVKDVEMVIAANGRPPRLLTANGRAITGAGGRKLGAVVVMHDLTARKLAEAQRERAIREEAARREAEASAQRLRESEERYRQLVELSPDAVFVNAGGTVVFANRAMARLLGAAEPSEMIGRSVWDLADPQVRAIIEKRIERMLATGQPAPPMEQRWRRRDGSWLPAEAVAAPVPWRGTTAVQVVLRDLTERRRVEAALRESEERFRLMADAVPQIVWITDAEGRVQFFNKQWSAYTGVPYEPTTATEVAATFVHPDDAAATVAAFDAARRSGGTFSVEHRIRSAAGEYRWFLVRAEPYRDPQTGHITRWFGASVDIHDRRLAEGALRESEERLQFLNDLGERTRDLTDPEEVMTTVARTLGEHLRVSRCAYAEVEADSDRFTIRHDFTDGCPSTVGTYRLDLFGPRAAADQRSGRTLVIRDVDAELTPAEGADAFNAIHIKAIVCCPLVREGRLVAMMAVHQTTSRRWTPDEVALVEIVVERSWAYIERARAVRAVAESEARFRQLADAMPQMVWVTRPDGFHEYYNPRWYEFTGVPVGSTDGEGWNGMFHPDDQDRAWAAWRHSLATGEPYEIEYRLRHRSGEYRWTLGRALPIRDAGGAITRWFGTCTDIDAIKRLQQDRERLLDSERSARAEAERASRMKDEFLATLSHELRTPLNAILGWSQILAHGTKDAEDLAEGLRTIERNARAQTQIIEDLLDMSRIISGKVRLDVQRIDLAVLVHSAIETTRPSADAKGIRLHAVLDPSAGPVSGDPNRLQQVFWNLLTNAVKFTPRGGRVQVVLERVDSNVEIRVIDTGEGIRPEFLPHVFDRFRQADATTTRRHGGLGLGLSIVKQLVELHGGSVRVKSAGVGRGATFTVALPLTAIHPEPHTDVERDHPRAASATTGPLDTCVQIRGVKVLVVDDEPDARGLIKRLLEDCDAEVITAGSAAEALELVRAERPDVLASDVGMPGEDGYSLIRRVRALRPDEGGRTPAIALTAYARAEDRVKAMLAGFQMHLTKPVEPAELVTTVASLIGRTGPEARHNSG